MKKVLVLDDQKEILELWHWHFKLWGEHVELFTGINGDEGIALQKKHKFDLIITDSLEFIAQARMNDRETPIFLFKRYLPELGFLATRLENVMYFEKPLIGGKLRTAINYCLNGQLFHVEAI